MAPSLHSFGRMRENHVKSQRLSNHNWLKYIPPVCKLPSQEITPYGVCDVTEPGYSNHTGTIPTHTPTPPLFPEHNYSGVHRLTECYSWKSSSSRPAGFPSIFFFNLQDPLFKGSFMEIQCVRQSAAMIEEKSEVKITPTPTPIPPNLSTQQMFIRPS